VRYLSQYGGLDVKETMDQVLKATLVNSLVLKYNMKGLKGKLQFQCLEFMSVLFSKFEILGTFLNVYIYCFI